MAALPHLCLVVVFIHFVSSQNVNFKLPEAPNDDINTRTGEEDVNTRFINLDLNQFAGQVAASALGTVLGNAGGNLASNYLSNCGNRGKRSILMHKIEKRQVLEANAKLGNSDKSNNEPEVQDRIICPQDFLGQGGNSGQSYCDRCNCNNWDCRRDCRKCGNYGWSSSGSSGNSWNSGSQHSGSYTSSSCRKCSSSCRRSYSCRRRYNCCSNSSYSTNSGTNCYGSCVYRNSVKGRTGENSEKSTATEADAVAFA